MSNLKRSELLLQLELPTVNSHTLIIILCETNTIGYETVFSSNIWLIGYAQHTV